MSDKTRRDILTPIVLGLVGLWAVNRCSRRRRRRREDARRRHDGPSPGDHARVERGPLAVAVNRADLAAWKAAPGSERRRLEADGRVFLVPAGTRIYVRLTRGSGALIDIRSGDLSGRSGWADRRSLQ